jgi:hypothetical protein
MKKLVKFKENWGGGEWTVDGKPVKCIYKVEVEGCGEFDVKQQKIQGQDYDHGHHYAWVNYDYLLFAKVQGLLFYKSIKELKGANVYALNYEEKE